MGLTLDYLKVQRGKYLFAMGNESLDNGTLRYLRTMLATIDQRIRELEAKDNA